MRTRDGLDHVAVADVQLDVVDRGVAGRAREVVQAQVVVDVVAVGELGVEQGQDVRARRQHGSDPILDQGSLGHVAHGPFDAHLVDRGAGDLEGVDVGRCVVDAQRARTDDPHEPRAHSTRRHVHGCHPSRS